MKYKDPDLQKFFPLGTDTVRMSDQEAREYVSRIYGIPIEKITKVSIGANGEVYGEFEIENPRPQGVIKLK